MDKNRRLAVLALVFLGAFLYQLQEVLRQHSTWGYFQQPPGVGEILFAACCGIGAVGATLGIDLPALTKSFLRKDSEP